MIYFLNKRCKKTRYSLPFSFSKLGKPGRRKEKYDVDVSYSPGPGLRSSEHFAEPSRKGNWRRTVDGDDFDGSDYVDTDRCCEEPKLTLLKEGTMDATYAAIKHPSARGEELPAPPSKDLEENPHP